MPSASHTTHGGAAFASLVSEWLSTIEVAGRISRVTQAPASPAFPPMLSLLTWVFILTWLGASLANPLTRVQLLQTVGSCLLLPLFILVAASIFPFMRGFLRIAQRASALVLGAGILGGIGVAKGVRGAAAGGRGEPRDLVIELKDDKTGEALMVRFPRANGDVSMPAGARLAARGRVQGTTLVAERMEVQTALGVTTTSSSGMLGRVLGYVRLLLFAMLALSAVASLVR